MKESCNTKFFQFFLALVITIVVSETILTHVTKEAYAKESTDSQFIAVERDSDLSQAALANVLGAPKEVPATTVAMKIQPDTEPIQIETVGIRPQPSFTTEELAEATFKAKAAKEELNTAEEAETLEADEWVEEEADVYTETVETASNDWSEAESNDASDETTETTTSTSTTTTEQKQETVVYEEEPEEEASSEQSTSDNGMTLLGSYRLTAYCPCTQCCGANANGMTASGTWATAGRTIAADPGMFPFGTVVYIEGIGTFTVEDRGVYGNTIDIFFNTHSEALQFGCKYANVYIVG